MKKTLVFITCRACDGTGQSRYYEYRDCDVCDGAGTVASSQGRNGAKAALLALAVAAVAYFAPAAIAGNAAGPAAACGTNSVNKCLAAAPDDPMAFLCYSRFQTDPGAWPVEQAKTLLAAGYWAPYAETTTPTLTRLSTGVYLDCQGVASGGTVGGDGTVVDGSGWTANTPGFYPVG